MRILHVRFSNLNSLTGEWAIDFADPEYLANGIFAITGPTGSGKSTILDAICLALYAETPRLGKITKSSNEIMARQTGECFSEVEFETAKGRFRCHFSQRRAYGRAKGELQNQKHEIVDVVTGKPLETKLRQVTNLVTEVTGMDFDRFTRSILLAQGGFSKFLLARASERAPILEKITGTEIYSRISVKVHEQSANERKKFEQLNNELEATQLLSEEEQILIDEELKKCSAQSVALASEIRSLISSLTWLESISKLEKDISCLELAAKELTKRKEDMAPSFLRLAKAEKAGSLEAEYVKLSALRKRQEDESVQLKGQEKKLKVLAESLMKATDSLEKYEVALNKIDVLKQQEAILITRVRDLDTKLDLGRKSLTSQVGEIQGDAKKRGILRAEIIVVDGKITGLEQKLSVIETYLAQRKNDESLLESLEGIRHRIQAAVGLDEKHSEVVKALGRANESIQKIAVCLAEKEKVFMADQEQVNAQKNNLTKIQEEMDELLGSQSVLGLRQDYEGLEQRCKDFSELAVSLEKIDDSCLQLVKLQGKFADLQKNKVDLFAEESAFVKKQKTSVEIVRHLSDKRDLVNQVLSLEEKRLLLVDDKPCPLCGALEHPYAKGNIPQLAGIEQELKDAQIALDKILEEISTCKLQQVEISKDFDQCVKNIKQLEALLAQEEKNVAVLWQSLKLAVGVENRSKVVAVESSNSRLQADQLKLRLAQVEKKLEEQQILQQKISVSRDKLDKSGESRNTEQNRHESQLQEISRFDSERQTFLKDMGLVVAEVDKILKPFAVEKFLPKNAGQLLNTLELRRRSWKEKKSGKETIERQLASLLNDKKTAEILWNKLGADLDRKRCKLRTASLTLHGLFKERRELYGCKDPDREEKRLSLEFDAANKVCQTEKTRVTALGREQYGLQGEVERLSCSTKKRCIEIDELEAQWILSLQGAEFASEAAFLQIRLEREEQDRLIVQRDKLRTEEIELAAQQADRKYNLLKEKRKQVTDKKCEELQQIKKDKDEELQQVQQQIGGIKERLALDSKNRQHQQEKIKVLEAQKKECSRWQQLHSLIGSSDGKKFRMFAQGLTFEMMIVHANHKLQEMSDRYILIRDDEQPLELGVIDNYQAGEIRSTKNLSGGESFIVSLALALGLSNMASRNVRVDSLFLDEGFGTLDEDALETALETLSGLHQDGKLIGVISHVPALKERIAAQIRVVPGIGGHSQLHGPGCVSLSEH